MKKRTKLHMKLFAALLVSCTVLLAFSFSNSVSAETIYGENGDDISCAISQNHYIDGETITIAYHIRSEATITSFICAPQGFDVVSSGISAEDAKKIVVALSPTGAWESASFSIEVLLSSGNTVSDSLYATQNENGIFVSPLSLGASYEAYLDYAVEEGLMTWEESEILFAKYGASCAEETVTTVLLPTQIGGAVSTNSTGTVDTYASGTITWKDDGGISHPLRGAMVEIYDENSIIDECLGTVYTDNQGSFSLGFSNRMSSGDNGCDLYVRVYAGDENVKLKSSAIRRHYYQSEPIPENEDVVTGSNTIFNISFDMTTDLGKAMQISQAALTARDYAKAMMGSTPTDVSVRYPGLPNSNNEEKCYYLSDSDTIHITNKEAKAGSPESYASWDVIMHEYGHHLQDQLNTTENPGGKHNIDENQIDFYYNYDINYPEDAGRYANQNHKEMGVKLAWAEGWATAFGQVAQHYYREQLQNISSVNNGQYDSYDIQGFAGVESSGLQLGEGNEECIIAVLWDLFDPANSDEPNDTINLDYQGFWNITTISGTYTFSDFFDNFISAYPQHRFAVGDLLSQYHMASSVPYVQETVNNQGPHTIFFNAQGGSVNHPNNEFSVYVYDQNGTKILTASYAEPVEDSTTGLYQITFYGLHWQRILEAPGATYTVQIAAFQDDTYDTGGYLSGRSDSICKPSGSVQTSLFSTISIPANTRYKEYISTLQPNQGIEYTTTFNASATYVIQTFGTRDTKLLIYNESGVLLVSDDDSGYSTNAFLSFTVTSGAKYIIRVELTYAPSASDVKLVFTPTDTAYSSYESFAGGSNNTSAYSTSLSTYDAVYYRFTSNNSEMCINFEADATFNSYLYLIDPRSAKPITEDIGDYTIDYEYGSGNYGGMASDYGGSGTDAQFYQRLEAGVPYLVIVTAFAPNTQSGTLTLWIDQFIL